MYRLNESQWMFSPPSRTSLSVVLPQAQAAEGSAQADPSTPSSSGRHNTKLPSFISLSSSPEDADAPDTPPADRSEVTGERAYRDQEGYGPVQGRVLQRSGNCLCGFHVGSDGTQPDLEGWVHQTECWNIVVIIVST